MIMRIVWDLDRVSEKEKKEIVGNFRIVREKCLWQKVLRYERIELRYLVLAYARALKDTL